MKDNKKLTKEELEEFNKLRFGFNIIEESEDYHIQAIRRVEISRPIAKKLLTFTFYLNCISLGCFVLSLFLTYTKPYPVFYGSVPNGKIYPLETMKLPKRK